MKRILILILSLLIFVCGSLALVSCSCNSIPDEPPIEQPTPEDPQPPETPANPEPEDPKDPEEPEEPEVDLFKDVKFDDLSVVYDGEFHTILFKGLPEDCIVNYTNAKGYKDAGTYNLTASVKIDEKDKNYTATLTINKATLDVIAKEELVYAGQTVSYEYGIKGFKGEDKISDVDTLPTYSGTANLQASAGKQENVITFSNGEDNNYDFNYIAADLTIEQITPDFSNGYCYYGKYPQSVLNDQDLCDEIETKLESGLLFADSETGVITYKGKSYFRKEAVVNTYIDNYKVFSNGETVENGKVYYFNVEPIKWKILSSDNGYFLMSESLLDVQQFNTTVKDVDGENGSVIKANDWDYSYIKEWLNGYFAETALGGYTNNLIAKDGEKIILPTLADLSNTAYGFNTDADRKAMATDFAIASGAILYETDASGYYWLSDAKKVAEYDNARVSVVKSDGDHDYDYWNVISQSCCVRACILLDID